jgi:Caspase domain
MLLRHCLLLCCALLGFMAPLAQANTEPRLALLIGNATYKASPLANPVNDVRLMEGALKEAGFTVIKAENASIRDMRRLVRDFGDKLKATGGVGLFYFAGHGVQVRGENFLVSTDSDIRNEDEVADEALNASVILEKMQTAGNRMNLIILDACRNNPFAVKSRSASAGLATMSAPSGSLVAYSTAPGSVASDGSGKNGLYTEHLAKVLRQPGLPVEEVFKQVRAAVRKDSNNQQTPWENTALEGQFYFKPAVQLAAPAPGLAPATAANAGSQNAPDPAALELAFWDSVKNSQRPGELQAYIDRFPNGTFAMLAKSRLLELPGGAAKPASVAPARIAESVPSPEANASIGTLVLTDSVSGLKSNVAGCCALQWAT